MKDERYLTLLLDDAVANVEVPPHERWFPRDLARRSGLGLGSALGLLAAAAVLVVVGVFIGQQRGSQVGTQPTASPLTTATPATTPTPSANVVDTPVPASATQGWILVRDSLPSNVPVLRPGWLPDRYAADGVIVEYAHDVGGWRYRVGYGTGNHTILFALGSVNSARPDSTEALTMRGVSVTISKTSSWPAIQAIWDESGGTYTIQSNDLTRDELVRILDSLQGVSGS
jgi:hypothetical protein